MLSGMSIESGLFNSMKIENIPSDAVNPINARLKSGPVKSLIFLM